MSNGFVEKCHSAQHCLLSIIENGKPILDQAKSFGAFLTYISKEFDSSLELSYK